MKTFRGLVVARAWTLSLALLPGAALAQPLTFTHLAGSLGGPGFVDGTGTAASFNRPDNVAVDGAGNLYVADTFNNSIRKVTPAGVVTTLAGSATRGSADGTGAAASFWEPSGVAVDGAGNVYASDSANHKIRKISPGGEVTTLAGSTHYGSADGQGTAASFNYPWGVAVDSAGNVYVADYNNSKIRKVTPSGAVSTLAGSGAHGSSDGTGAGASFSSPAGVAVDAAGNVYVADGNNKIRKVTSAGVVTTIAGSGAPGSTDGPGAAASFRLPYAVAVDGAGNLFVADSQNNKVRRISPGGVVTTFAGSGSFASTDGNGTAAAFNTPQGVAADLSGNLYVADTGNSKIRKITPAAAVTTVAGSGAAGTVDGMGPAALFSYPMGVAADGAGNVYVSDGQGNKIRRVTAGGVVTTLAGSGAASSVDGTGSSASFYFPWGLAVDGVGNLYVADGYGSKIRKVTPAGAVSTLAGSGIYGFADGVGSEARFNNPSGVAVDGAGNVYVADTLNNRIRKVTPSGVVTTLAGSGANGSTNGTGAAASFYFPQGIAVDSSGNVYVADTYGLKIRKITPAGVVTTFAGGGTTGGGADGVGTAASFLHPDGLAVDGAGNVYVSDTGNNKIRKVTPDGTVTTLGGSGSFGHADGTGTAASFANPRGIAVDGSGKVYVADAYNNAIRVGQRLGSATCTPDDTNLCLLAGRFRLSADYTTYDGIHGTGKAVYLTPDTGYFWFFDAANVEVVPKMINSCNVSNSVAIYAGGLTDLGVTLHVVDTRDGTSMDYQNTLGDGFRMIQDGRFNCPAGVTLDPAPVAAHAGDDGMLETTTVSEAPPELEGVCTADGTTLCILGGRFQVKASYLDYDGKTGQGQAVPITSDTGYFWFFGPNNVEVVVKIVSFCGSGSNNIAVYAGGMTDVKVVLTVTDVQTGLVKTYTNPFGRQFKLINDGPFSCR